MRFHKLRIAWSVLFVIACVLLIVLWVRSYQWADGVSGTCGRYGIAFHVINGELMFTRILPTEGIQGVGPWHVVHIPMTRSFTEQIEANRNRVHSFRGLGIRWGSHGEGWQLAGTLFWPTLFVVGLAAVPWMSPSKRFWLRTLLIATTLVAVVLGLIVWAAGN